MSDDQTPQVPPAIPPTPSPQVSKSLQDRLGDWLKNAYETNKLVFFTAGLVIGVIFLAIKYHDILIDILLGSAKQIDKDALSKEASLKQQADKTKLEADALVAKAQAAPGEEKPVPDDWFKK
jgi:hypothetical protein